MSLVPHYVKMTDGNYYKEPVIYGDDWYICFDDDEDPELIIKHSERLNETDRLVIIHTLLDKLDIKYKIVNHEQMSQRCFPPDYNSFHKTISCFLKIKRNININQYKFKHDGIYPERKFIRGQYVIYDFG